MWDRYFAVKSRGLRDLARNNSKEGRLVDINIIKYPISCARSLSDMWLYRTIFMWSWIRSGILWISIDSKTILRAIICESQTWTDYRMIHYCIQICYCKEKRGFLGQFWIVNEQKEIFEIVQWFVNDSFFFFEKKKTTRKYSGESDGTWSREKTPGIKERQQRDLGTC